MRKIYTTVAFTLLWILLAAQSDPFILKEDTLLTKADQMPFFTGCEMLSGSPEEKRECSDKELVHFLSRYLVYPEEARNQGIEGTVLVSFIIDETGKVVQPEVLKDIGGGCGAAAIEVVGKMPRWQPAIHQGRAVKVRMNLPIQFFLRAEGRDEAEPYTLSWGGLTGNQTTKKQLLENLSNKIYVRGPEGSNRFIDHIEFIFEKDNRYIIASGKSHLSDELRKVVERVKRGGVFTIQTSVQDKGRFLTVSRSFRVVK